MENLLLKLNIKYEVMSFLGEGGYALVYKARSRLNNQIVALKIYKNGDHTNGISYAALRELVIQSAVNDLNVVKYVLDYS